jgi:hypothetical protein
MVDLLLGRVKRCRGGRNDDVKHQRCSRRAIAMRDEQRDARIDGGRRKGVVASGRLGSLSSVGAWFIGGDREQVFLMPPLGTDWVAEDDFIRTVRKAVGELDPARARRLCPGRRGQGPSLAQMLPARQSTVACPSAATVTLVGPTGGPAGTRSTASG